MERDRGAAARAHRQAVPRAVVQPPRPRHQKGRLDARRGRGPLRAAARPRQGGGIKNFKVPRDRVLAETARVAKNFRFAGSFRRSTATAGARSPSSCPAGPKTPSRTAGTRPRGSDGSATAASRTTRRPRRRRRPPRRPPGRTRALPRRAQPRRFARPPLRWRLTSRELCAGTRTRTRSWKVPLILCGALPVVVKPRAFKVAINFFASRDKSRSRLRRGSDRASSRQSRLRSRL